MLSTEPQLTQREAGTAQAQRRQRDGEGETKAGCDGGAETASKRWLGEGLQCHLEPLIHLSPTLFLAPAFNAERVSAWLH